MCVRVYERGRPNVKSAASLPPLLRAVVLVLVAQTVVLIVDTPVRD